MLINLNHYCNNKAHVLQLGSLRLHFSYETCIALGYKGERIRLANVWGPTTGRHINQMGICKYREVTVEEFMTKVHAAVMQHGLDQFNASLAV
jgi:hypothetical protein